MEGILAGKFKQGDLTEKVIVAALEVHKFLGNGYPEVIYQRGLAVELERASVSFAREQEMSIYYKDHPQPLGSRRADFVVDGKVLVELKAISFLEDSHANQVLNYLKVYRMKVGLLLNFGGKKLEIKRFVL